ncbi:hypothetical protein MPER_11280 [Moniliophthora perniciosa FA553]|nr:hypothetical protein MPER_11280 [Moniliophthora perniciosa FA553]
MATTTEFLAAANKAHFNENAHNYDATPYILEAAKQSVYSHAMIGEGILAEIPFDKESTIVMDFACGTGLVANVLVPHSKALTGIDISEGMINQFTQRFEKQGLSSDKVRGIRKELKGEPGDVVVGGHLVIIDNEPTTVNTDTEADGDLPKHTIGKPDGFTGAEMEKLFTDAGLLSYTYHHLTQF